MGAHEPYDFELDPVEFITVGAVGPPGQRAFYLQASAGGRLVSLLIEKEHAAALSLSLRRLLQSADAEPSSRSEPAEDAMALREPVDPDFRVGQMGLGIDEDRDLVVLVAEELVADDEPEGRRARFAGTFEQMDALARRAMKVVQAGRPVCELCGEPMEPDGHYCARRNGHPPPDD